MRFSLTSWFVILLIIIVAPAQAQEVVDLYSDLQSSDVTVEGDVDGYTLQVDLLFSNKIIQAEHLLLNGPGVWIVRWDVPGAEEGAYSACAKLSKDDEIASEGCFDFYYGARVPLRFDVRDFRADNRGAHLLMHSRDLAVADVYYMLIKDNKALYISTDESLPISSSAVAPTQIDHDWKQLLENNEEYLGRVKIIEARNNQTRAFMNPFIAKDDAEITDTYEDETGASATVVGNSRVPFDGTLRFVLSQNDSVITSVEEKTPVLLTDDDETVEISWNDTLDPGLYHLKILLLGNDGDVIDFEESIIEAEIPPRPPVVEVPKNEESSQTLRVLGLLGLFAAFSILVVRKRKG